MILISIHLSKYHKGSIARLITTLRSVDQLHLTLMDQIGIIRLAAVTRAGLGAGGDDSQDDTEQEEEEEADVSKKIEKVCTAVDRSSQEKFPFLEHPGTVLYLKRQIQQESPATISYLAIEKPSLASPKSLFLLSRMVSDHKLKSYREAFNSVLY